MIKFCPIMSFQKQYNDEECCMDEACALWDEERGQCCIKTMALAVAGNKGGSTPFSHATYEQAQYIPPTAIPNPNINSPYTIIC
jgi:hypothetical protein